MRKFVGILLFFCILWFLPGGGARAAAPGVFAVILETPSPLEMYAGDDFAVVIRVTPSSGEAARFAALSSGGRVMAESDLVVGLEADVPRQVILYGKAGPAGLSDISQIQVKDSAGQVAQTLGVDALLVRVLEKPAIQDTVQIRMGSFSHTPYLRNEFTLKLTLRNTGTAPARDVILQFNSDLAFVRGGTNLLQIPDIAAGGSRDVTVKMGLSSTGSPVYRIPVSVSCALPSGERRHFEEIITLTAADLGLKVTEPVLGTPRVFLKQYTLSSSGILAGDTVTLTIVLENSSSREVRNLKVSLAAVPGEGSTGGTVFSPVNSSSSFYIERIGPKQTHSKSVDLYADPNAAARTYLVPLEILYEDAQGGAYSVSENISIPVLQESRLQVLGVEAPFLAFVGQAAAVTAEFVNVGKVALKNLLVTIEGDFPKESASLFLASFEIGQSDYFQGFIIPRHKGLLQGKVVFTYVDSTNQEISVELPFQVEVQEAEKPGPFPPDGYPPGKSPGNARFLFWLLPLVLVLGLGGFLIRRRRARSGEIFHEEL